VVAAETIRATQFRDRGKLIKVRPIKARLRLNKIEIIPTGSTLIETMTKTTVMRPRLRYVLMVTTRIIPTPVRPTDSMARGGL
jgi:hypothetical protein